MMAESEHDPEEEVTLGARVEAKTRKSKVAIVAVRLSPDLLARLNDYAELRDLTVSEVLRRGAEMLIAGNVQEGPVYHTGVVLSGTNLVYGSASGSTSRSSTIEAAEHDKVIAF